MAAIFGLLDPRQYAVADSGWRFVIGQQNAGRLAGLRFVPFDWHGNEIALAIAAHNFERRHGRQSTRRRKLARLAAELAFLGQFLELLFEQNAAAAFDIE